MSDRPQPILVLDAGQSAAIRAWRRISPKAREQRLAEIQATIGTAQEDGATRAAHHYAVIATLLDLLGEEVPHD